MTIKSILSRMIAMLVRPALGMTARAGQLLNHALLQARLKSRLSDDVLVLGQVEVRGTARIELGVNVRVYPGVYLETRESGTISIGDGVVISRGVHIVSRASITIGNGTMIGEYTSVRDANHQRERGSALRYAGHQELSISIGKEVWIGRGVAILPGVSIGDDATIGANAVVTHDVEAGSKVAGVPAVKIVPRITTDRGRFGKR